jgi:hypothetical protein
MAHALNIAACDANADDILGITSFSNEACFHLSG